MLLDLLAASIVVGALVDVDAGGVVVGVAQEPGQAGTLAAPHRVQTLLKIRDLIKIQGRYTFWRSVKKLIEKQYR